MSNRVTATARAITEAGTEPDAQPSLDAGPDRRRHPRREQLTEAQAAEVEHVFTTHHRYIENVARQNAPTPDDVPDIVQQVGLQVCRGLWGFRGDADMRTWLYRVTVNVARDYYRSEAKYLMAVEVLTVHHSDQVVDPDDTAVENQRLDRLRSAVGRLRDTHRVAIERDLSNQSGHPLVQSVEKESTLKARRHKARRELRTMLADDPRFQN